MKTVKVLKAALDEITGGSVVLRGVIDPESLEALQVASYQREVLDKDTIDGLEDALKTGRVPDIELGLRGEGLDSQQDYCILSDPIFIIDGLQRVTAAKQLLSKGEHRPHIGATIHFNTDEKWERERFRILNANRSKLSPNILLRNMKEDNEVVQLFYNLTMHEQDFLMYGRVCWAQSQKKDHLLHAPVFLRMTGVAHSRFGAARQSGLTGLANGLLNIMNRLGRETFRANIKTFWGLFEECWGVRNVSYREGAVHMRSGFLWCIAEIMNRYENFWRGNELFIEADLRRKIALFKITDPYVKELAGSAGQARKILFQMLINHINSGKRTKHLKPFKETDEDIVLNEEEQEEEEKSSSERA